jgi:hypothetical protein
MPDNVAQCCTRLLCGHEELRTVVEKNIVYADGLKYDWRFGELEILCDGLFVFD